VLPAPLARRIGVTKFEQEAKFEIDGRLAEGPLYKQLYASQIGPLVQSPIAIAPLFFAQEMSGLGKRQPHPGTARGGAGRGCASAGGSGVGC
jgi:hypothetical protein